MDAALPLLAALLVGSAAPPARTPVIVELFSSEGCSSCPAADEVLSELDREQPVAGVQVIAIELHVDYWNQLGWADPFSQHAFTLRQERYAPRFGLTGVYTPQMIVDGSAELVGSRLEVVLESISAAATRGHPARISLQRFEARVAVDVESAPPNAVIVGVTTESGLATRVERGENAGRLLRHGPVARDIQLLGRVAADGSFHGVLSSVATGKNRRQIVFVQDVSTAAITGAAILDLGP